MKEQTKEELFRELTNSDDIHDVVLSLWPSGVPRMRGKYTRKPNEMTHDYEGFWTFDSKTEWWKPSKVSW